MIIIENNRRFSHATHRHTADNRRKEIRRILGRYKGYEKGESQKFWIDLLEHVYGVENITEFIAFEDQVHLDHTS